MLSPASKLQVTAACHMPMALSDQAESSAAQHAASGMVLGWRGVQAWLQPVNGSRRLSGARGALGDGRSVTCFGLPQAERDPLLEPADDDAHQDGGRQGLQVRGRAGPYTPCSPSVKRF